ncbi:MAG: hypothetical protein ABI867_16565 [Kofleriaceae bacterium]
MRLRSLLLASLAVSGVAHAQPGATPPTQPKKQAPQDPYATPVGPVAPAPAPVPAPPPAPAPPRSDDPVLAEQVAAALVHRAQELYDARVWADSKQLAVEALAKSPRGAAADQARYLIKSINQQLGITEEDKPTEQVDLTPIEDPTKHKGPIEAQPEQPERARRLTTSLHVGLYTGLLGTTIGAFFSSDSPASGAIPMGIGMGIAGGYALPRFVDKLHWNEGQVRTTGSGIAWGGVVGGLFGDIGKKERSSSRQVLVGASIGATLGGAGGVLLARENRYTPGDIALVDTFAGMGAVGGLTIGMLMQPVESEAYSLNSALGAAGGVIVGMIAAPQTNTTPRRMARVAGLAAAGGAVPFLLYAGIYDKNSHGDERAVGALSSLGLVAGAYIGFRLTRGMDEGKDAMPRKPSDDDAPASLLGRSSSGRWQLGSVALQPLSPQLAPQRGMSLSLVGGAW